VKKTQNKGYFAVQGHSRSSRSVPIQSPYVIFSLVTDILSRTVSSSIVQILDTLRLSPTEGRGLSDNVRCLSWANWKARGGLPISVNSTFFSLGVNTTEALRAKMDRKSAISLQCGLFDPTSQVERVAIPTNHFLQGELGCHATLGCVCMIM